jgi:hypothetical protein
MDADHPQRKYQYANIGRNACSSITFYELRHPES